MTEEHRQRAIIVGIAERTSDVPECDRGLNELERLLDTAGADVAYRVMQVKDSFDPRTCIGSGKVFEISELCSDGDIDLVVFDFELSPSQIKNLENDIKNVSVIDRSMLILDIFALHATSGEGKLQVELAQLRYSAQRLIGHGTELSRQGGGIGSRGPGETKLETDRRHLKEKVNTLERRLEEMEHNRAVMRSQRDKSGLPKVALVGYTNAGKSTLMNALTDAGVLSEDKLFATLDPTTRKYELPCGENILLTDTVGFIRKLPHHLVKAFKSTLDEVRYADIILIVCDASDDEMSQQLEVTLSVIEELGAADKPVLLVYNKCDLLEGGDQLVDDGEICVRLSAKTGEGIDRLLMLLEDLVNREKKQCKLLIPYTEQSMANVLFEGYTVLKTDYLENGVYFEAVLDRKGLGIFKKFITEEQGG